jgi:hypothetical protein
LDRFHSPSPGVNQVVNDLFDNRDQLAGGFLTNTDDFHTISEIKTLPRWKLMLNREPSQHRPGLEPEPITHCHKRRWVHNLDDHGNEHYYGTQEH